MREDDKDTLKKCGKSTFTSVSQEETEALESTYPKKWNERRILLSEITILH